MTQEVEQAGYEDLQNYISDNWDYIELVDDEGDAVTRIGVADERLNITIEDTEDDGDNDTVRWTVEVQGSDEDIPLGTTLEASRLFKEETGGDVFHTDTHESAPIASEDDTVQVQHDIEVPEIV